MLVWLDGEFCVAIAALIVIDVQKGFDQESYWGPRNNPECDANIIALLDGWQELGYPVVYVRHDSTERHSPLRAGTPGNAFKSYVKGEPSLLVTKSVNSAFYGSPDLHRWLQEHGIRVVVICGVTTNHCCETTARMAGNLGYEVRFVIDATHTFDRRTPDGRLFKAEDIAAVTAANLHREFATVMTTRGLLGEFKTPDAPA